MILAAALVIIRNDPPERPRHSASGCSTSRSLVITRIGSIAMSGDLTAETTSSFLVGFLTVVEPGTGDYQGGYLCIDAFGTPVECRYTTSAVRPTRAQTLLYGQALEPQLLGRSIAGTLLENLEHEPTIVLTDREAVLRGLGARGFPVAEVVSRSAGNMEGSAAQTIEPSKGTALLRGPTDGCAVAEPILEQLRKPTILSWRLVSMCAIAEPILEQLRGFDVWEPFERIKNVLAETRKAAVTKPDG